MQIKTEPLRDFRRQIMPKWAPNVNLLPACTKIEQLDTFVLQPRFVGQAFPDFWVCGMVF
jgi:hypothetical protein